MKRSKILIPTLSALAVAPAIAITGCSQGKSTEQKIIDAFLTPVDLEKSTMPKATFTESYNAMTDEEKQIELIYDLFCEFNLLQCDDNPELTIHDLYLKKNEGAWKVNVPYLEIKKNGDFYYASFRGYVSYVFEKQHKVKVEEETSFTFNANDFIMITYNFTDVKIKPQDSSLGNILVADFGCLGFEHYKYEGATKEALTDIPFIEMGELEVTNSKNWVKNV